jgi:hypothetical protein
MTCSDHGQVVDTGSMFDTEGWQAPHACYSPVAHGFEFDYDVDDGFFDIV